MGWLIVIIIIIFLAVKSDEAYDTSCLVGLVVVVGGVLITIAAFSFNPILGIIVGYFVYQGWKSMDRS